MRCTLYATGEKNKLGREYKCKHPGCERVLWMPHSVPDATVLDMAATCQLGTKAGPGLVEMGLDYAQEYARWVKHGMPARTPEQMAVNQAICQQCEFYAPHKKKPEQGSCKICSCRLNREESQFNKHYMGTTTCPYPLEPKWLPIVELQDG